jgi:hypothetical protein
LQAEFGDFHFSDKMLNLFHDGGIEGGVWIGADDGVVSFFESERRVDFLTGHEFGQQVMEGVQG